MTRKSGPFVLLFLLLAVPALSAQDNVRICAFTRAYGCSQNHECSEWTIEEMELPRFVRIDLEKNTIISLDKKVKREDTEIDRVEKLEGLTVLQGVELRAWSIALGQESGSLTLSASGDEHGFIVFGSCMDSK
jgi:hypothetical protein